MSARGPTQQDLVEAVAAVGVRDRRLLGTMREIPRTDFVPPGMARRAYVDAPVPIPHDQVTTQPSLVAKMVEALELEGGENVLEVGTGYGYQTAILARLGGFVWSIERWADLAEAAKRNLERHGIENVQVVVADGSEGLPEHAPFDAVLVSAAFPRVPEPLVEQLTVGGSLVQPLGTGGNEEVVLFSKGDRGLLPQRTITGARFVRLRGRHGY